MAKGLVMPALGAQEAGRTALPADRQTSRNTPAQGPQAELVQIDTVFVNLAPRRHIKHLTAYDPLARWTIAGLATDTPFTATGIQVDGGS